MNPVLDIHPPDEDAPTDRAPDEALGEDPATGSGRTPAGRRRPFRARLRSPSDGRKSPAGGGGRNRLPSAAVMNRGNRRRRAAVAIVLLAVLAAAFPAAAVFHDHPDHPERPETECRICEVSTTPVTVVRDGSALSVRADLPGLRVGEALPEVAPPTLRAHAARAPPA